MFTIEAPMLTMEAPMFTMEALIPVGKGCKCVFKDFSNRFVDFA